jgi:hypothetical protein
MRTRAVVVGASIISALSFAPLLLASPQSEDALAKAQRYVAQFERTFSSVLWHERYEQEDHVPRRFASSGTKFMELARRRTIDSDMLLLWIPREGNWIAVRDVLTVDGAPPPGKEGDLGATFQRPEISLEDLRHLAAENGRYNIGRILRTFSEPTLTLLFLDAQNRDRFRFKRAGDEPVGDRAAVVYQYDERKRPTLIRDESRDVPARGRVWIDPATGEILQTFLELNDRHGRITARMTVRYGQHTAFDVLVPVEMRETYTSELTGEQVTAVAAYSNFRKFETTARIISR